jgi:hypothetical protein
LRERVLSTCTSVDGDDDSVLRVREAGPHVGQLDRRHKRVLEQKARASGARKFAKSEQHSRLIILKIKIFKFLVSWKYEKYSQLKSELTLTVWKQNQTEMGKAMSRKRPVKTENTISKNCDEVAGGGLSTR